MNSVNKLRIYVTGIAGMMGYGIYRVLKDKAVIMGNDIVDVKIPGMEYSKISLLDMQKVEEDIKCKNIDILIHTAAMVHVDRCEKEPEMAKRLNTDVTAGLSELCDRNQIKMIYISTDSVFDGNEKKLYTEKDKTNPVNVYARTKLEGEYAVLQYKKNLVLRTNIYGRNIQNKESFGEWIYYSLIRDETLHMFSDIDFSPILVDELAKAIYLACIRDLSGIYHACGTGCITKYDFGVKMKEIFGITDGSILPAVSENMSLKAKRPKHMGMSNKKLCEALSMKISTPEQSIWKFYDLMKS